MDKVDIPFSISNLNQRTEEQAEQIRKVLEHIKPIECELLGEETVEAISRGETFESVGGGRHLSFMEIIDLLSGIATISQIAFLAIAGLRNAFKDKADAAQIITESKKIILEKISNHPELSDLSGLIAKDPIIVDRILTKILGDLSGSQK